MTPERSRFRAIYNDGESSAAHDVEASIGPDGVLIARPGAASVFWPADDVHGIEAPASQGLRLACEGFEGARLTIPDPAEAVEAAKALPGGGRRRASGRQRRRTLRWAAASIVGVLALGLAAFEGLPRAFAYLPMAWVAPIGDTMRGRINGFLGGDVCTEPEAVEALARLRGRLLAGVEESARFQPDEVDIWLTSHTIPNALAVPGGRLVIFHGLFDLLDEGADSGGDALAGVVAHEIAHARLRHPTRALGRALGMDFLGLLLGGGIGADFGGHVARLAYSREAEREADALAREMLKDAGIGDAGLNGFFQKVSVLRDKESGFFSSHPSPDERIAAGDGARGPERAFTEAEWLSLKSACRN